MPTVIHVSPHPDDESIAAPCTLLTLRDAGWNVVNFAASLGRPDDRDRRRRELIAALDVAGFEYYEASTTAGISGGDELGVACRDLTRQLRQLVLATRADLVIGPHPRDGHHGHATVARAIRQVVWESEQPLRWWMWSVWTDLPRPTIVVDCDPEHLAISLKMLDQHAGEIGRNDYREMHEAVRAVNAVRGREKAFGFGSAPSDGLRAVSRAELLTEVAVARRRWLVGTPRLLDRSAPLSTPDDWVELDDLSILSSTRLRPFYQAQLMQFYARFGNPVLDAPGAAHHGPGIRNQVERLVELASRSTSASRHRRKPRP